MDDSVFATHLCIWLDPLELTECASRLDEERDQALTSTKLIVASGHLSSGSDGNFAQLVTKLLRGFRIPPGLVRMLQNLQASPGSSKESWQWLNELTTSAIVNSYARDNVPSGASPNTILTIEERDLVLDLVRAPVLALLDLVEQLSAHWRQLAGLGVSVYHEPNMPTPFYAYVDFQVASSFLAMKKPSDVKGIQGPKFRYRAVTVYGCADETSPVWEIAQQAARNMAASTRQHTRGKTS